MSKKLIMVVLLLGLLVAIVAGWSYQQVITALNQPVINQQQTLVQVKPGTTFYGLIDQLVKEKLIEDSEWMRLVSRLEPSLTDIKAGTYAIEPKETLRNVLALVASGKEYQFSITLVDGDRFTQWRKQLETTKHLKPTSLGMSEAEIAKKLGIDNPKLEGYFLPNTYHFTAGTSDLEVLKRAHVAMMNVLNEAWQQREKSLPLKSPYQVLIMASIIEKETALPSERGLVASVFMNRLRRGMPLQTDPTVIYGMGDKYHGNITRKDLRTPTPYNTYTIRGLPPTPIAMPSAAAIFAAVKPDTSNYYYFVANGKGGHTFSTTLAEHNRAVRAYLKILRKQEK